LVEDAILVPGLLLLPPAPSLRIHHGQDPVRLDRIQRIPQTRVQAEVEAEVTVKVPWKAHLGAEAKVKKSRKHVW
jgi:hypothetical protein